MKRFLTGAGLGLAGIALAFGLTVGALAVAGPDVGKLPTPPTFHSSPTPSPTADRTPGNGQEGKDDDRHADETPSVSPSPSRPTAGPSIDDHGGSGGSGSSDDSGGGGDDHSGPGGGDDDGHDDD
jgi:hypothetical protein